MNDGMVHQLETLWKSVFPDTMLLLGSSSGNNGINFLTHSLGSNMLLQMNGLTSSSSLLAKNAFYSVECYHGKYINLYEIKLPDIPGRNGELSTVQLYINTLAEQSLDVAGNSPSWSGLFLTVSLFRPFLHQRWVSILLNFPIELFELYVELRRKFPAVLCDIISPIRVLLKYKG